LGTVREGGNTEFSSAARWTHVQVDSTWGIEIRLSIRHLRGMDCNLPACLDLYQCDDNLESAQELRQISKPILGCMYRYIT